MSMRAASIIGLMMPALALAAPPKAPDLRGLVPRNVAIYDGLVARQAIVVMTYPDMSLTCMYEAKDLSLDSSVEDIKRMDSSRIRLINCMK